jgi:1-deoxy-D-xylulose-5-phosphate synthase
MNEEELRNMMYTAMSANGPTAIRYPRGSGVMKEWQTAFKLLQPGKGRKVSDGKDIALISIGHVGNFALQAAERLQKDNISAACFDMRFLKPVDTELLHEVFTSFELIITIEDGTIVGGLGSTVVEFQSDHSYTAKVKRLGIPDQFIGHGKQEELHRDCGYDTEGIIESAKEMLGRKKGHK